MLAFYSVTVLVLVSTIETTRTYRDPMSYTIFVLGGKEGYQLLSCSRYRTISDFYYSVNRVGCGSEHPEIPIIAVFVDPADSGLRAKDIAGVGHNKGGAFGRSRCLLDDGNLCVRFYTKD